MTPETRGKLRFTALKDPLVQGVWTMESAESPPNREFESLKTQVRSAIIWRSGSQIVAQLKWPFVGALFVVVILVWVLRKGIRRLRRR